MREKKLKDSTSGKALKSVKGVWLLLLVRSREPLEASEQKTAMNNIFREALWLLHCEEALDKQV